MQKITFINLPLPAQADLFIVHPVVETKVYTRPQGKT